MSDTTDTNKNGDSYDMQAVHDALKKYQGHPVTPLTMHRIRADIEGLVLVKPEYTVGAVRRGVRRASDSER